MFLNGTLIIEPTFILSVTLLGTLYVNKIFYTGNVSPPKDKIVKTNRYTQKNVLLRTSLYEWDYKSEEIVEEAGTAGGK